MRLDATTAGLSDELFDINTKGAYFTIQEELPFLNDGASIILNTLVADEAGVINGTVYAATKAALRSFTRSIAAEPVGRGIRVNAVSPGPVNTPEGFERAGLLKAAMDELVKDIVSKVPMKRIGQSGEIASVVAFLASSEPRSSPVRKSPWTADMGRSRRGSAERAQAFVEEGLVDMIYLISIYLGTCAVTRGEATIKILAASVNPSERISI